MSPTMRGGDIAVCPYSYTTFPLRRQEIVAIVESSGLDFRIEEAETDQTDRHWVLLLC